MDETQTLELDFEPASASARIFVATVYSYLKDSGQVVISKDCNSAECLGNEVERLLQELLLLKEQAQKRFTAAAGDDTGDAIKGSDIKQDSTIAQSKRPLRIDSSLVVADRMSYPVITIRRNQTLEEAEALLRAGGFRHLVVKEDETEDVIGIISLRQITLSALDWVMGHGVEAYRKIIASTPVKAVMETQIITVAKTAPVAEAAALLSQHKIGCMPVMDANQLVGILTEGDFVSMLRDSVLGQIEEGDPRGDDTLRLERKKPK